MTERGLISKMQALTQRNTRCSSNHGHMSSCVFTILSNSLWFHDLDNQRSAWQARPCKPSQVAIPSPCPPNPAPQHLSSLLDWCQPAASLQLCCCDTSLLGLGVRGDVVNSLLNSVDLLCLSIRDLHSKLVLERHHHLLPPNAQTTAIK